MKLKLISFFLFFASCSVVREDGSMSIDNSTIVSMLYFETKDKELPLKFLENLKHDIGDPDKIKKVEEGDYHEEYYWESIKGDLLNVENAQLKIMVGKEYKLNSVGEKTYVLSTMSFGLFNNSKEDLLKLKPEVKVKMKEYILANIEKLK